MVGKTKSDTYAGPLGIQPYKAKKNEEYMNEKQLEHFRNILETWKVQLQEERDRTVTHLQNDVTNYPDPIDLASQEETFRLDLKQSDRARKLIKRVDEALVRIKEGDYGYCVDCGAEIGVRRLEARPVAIKCIECKTVDEIREKQTGGS